MTEANDISAAKRQDLTLEQAYNRLAEEMPHGYTVGLMVEHGAGWVQIETPAEFEYWDAGDNPYPQALIAALEYCKQQAAMEDEEESADEAN